MIHVVDLPRGWELWADTECHEIRVAPLFRRGGLKLKAFEMAGHIDGPEVFRELDRLLKINDSHRIPNAHLPAWTLDVAKFSVELAFKLMDKWNPELKDSSLELARMR